MKFYEVVEQIRALLQRQGRASYRALKREFNLDDEYLEDLKTELIEAQRIAVDEGGTVLVWTGAASVPSSTFQVPRSTQPPSPSFQSSGVLHPTPYVSRAAGERRQLTVMFCDLVDSTALAEQLDPEEWRAVVQTYQQTCAEIIHRFNGTIAQYLGDGILVYFGYPAAHEDDAARAVRAGLEIVRALHVQVPSPLRGEGQGEGEQGSQCQETPYPNPLPQGERGFSGTFPTGTRRLQARIGIHTGLVVVGEMGGAEKREQLAVGDTPNIAARLQGLAAPNTILVSGTTQRLITGLFGYRDLGLQTLKGVSAPMQVYQITGESGVRGRIEAGLMTGLTPLVGREEEVSLLLRRWEQAKNSEGQVVLLQGEAGIGKSRLVQVIKEQLAQEPYSQIELRCSPFLQNSALYPVIEHVQRVLQFDRDDSREEKFQKLAAGAHGRAPLQSDTIPLLASLLSLPLPDSYPPLNLTPQRQKQKTLETLLSWLLAEADEKPVLLIVEDLHWIDPSTLELLGLILEQIPTARILVVMTFRSDFTPPWPMQAHLTQLTLTRFARKQVEMMVEKIAGGGLPVEVVQQIVSKTDGVPLFVEEVTKAVMEVENVGARHAVPLQSIPATLHDSLMARLDRLGPAKEVAQLGATLGREFSWEVLRAVSPLDEIVLQSALDKLTEAELLYQRGQPPQTRYIFKHALIQDAAYQSLLKSTRQQYHQQIAQVLEEQFTEVKETQPELLAHHYTEAGLIEQAIPYWQQAGQKAVQRSANEEAIRHFTKGLEILKNLPATSERIRQELALQIALGAPLVAAKGYAASEVEKAYVRARQLCQQLGETPQLFTVLRGLWVWYAVRSKLTEARQLGEQLLALAHATQDPAAYLEAYHALGQTFFHLGEFVLARENCEQGYAIYDSQQHHSHVFLYGTDPGIACLFWGSLALWFLGYPEQALQRSQTALSLAKELSHPLDLAYAFQDVASVHQYRREGQLAQKYAEATVALSNEQGLPFWLAFGIFIRGWSLAELGQDGGVSQMRQGITGWQTTGAQTWLPYYLTPLIEACINQGQLVEAESLLIEALSAVDKTGERTHEAELYRLKGELTLRQFNVQGSKFKVNIPHSAFRTPHSEAEACFLKAIDIARRQHAKMLELRATVSLARLWRQQGKQAEARRMLDEIYNWFTEGFDTKDLQEAKTLLVELNH